MMANMRSEVIDNRGSRLETWRLDDHARCPGQVGQKAPIAHMTYPNSEV